MLLLLALAVTGSAMAQQNKTVKWTVLTPNVTGAPGQIVEVKIQAKIDAGWHMYTTKKYPDTAEAAPSPTEVTVGEGSLITMAGRLKGTAPHVKFDDGFELNTEFWEGAPTLIVPVRISRKAKEGAASGWVNFYFQTCNNRGCNPPTNEKLTFNVEVSAKQAADSLPAAPPPLTGTVPPDTIARPTHDSVAQQEPAHHDTASPATTGGATPPGKVTHGEKAAPVSTEDAIAAAKAKGLLAYLLLAASYGLLALATPCVFPMIPITVSFFTKREQSSHMRAVRDGALYAFGIILTFSGLGFIISLIFGATGVTNFATNPWVNIGMAGVFLLLALNLFGLFEIQLPTSLLNRLNRTANKGSGPSSVILMGLVFSLTSFTCTVPFVGTLFGQASKGEVLWPLFGTAAFATVFSMPFFLLAVFPSLLKAMPRSGGWLNSVKVVMGFLEIAFAVKFLSGTDMVMKWGVFTRELVLSIWIAVSLLITVYLLGRFQLPHDTPVEKVGPIRVLFATSFLAIGFWLLTGLFGGRLGEVEAQLPPPNDASHGISIGATAANAQTPEPVWMQDDYKGALDRARREGKQVFIDFTGYFCTNCRLMERTMFNRREIADALQKFVLVRLYTDGRDEVNKQNLKMLNERFNTITVPYYAVFTPDDKIVVKFDGMTRDADQFLDFLQRGAAGVPAPLAASTP